MAVWWRPAPFRSSGIEDFVAGCPDRLIEHGRDTFADDTESRGGFAAERHGIGGGRSRLHGHATNYGASRYSCQDLATKYWLCAEGTISSSRGRRDECAVAGAQSVLRTMSSHDNQRLMTMYKAEGSIPSLSAHPPSHAPLTLSLLWPGR